MIFWITHKCCIIIRRETDAKYIFKWCLLLNTILKFVALISTGLTVDS